MLVRRRARAAAFARPRTSSAVLSRNAMPGQTDSSIETQPIVTRRSRFFMEPETVYLRVSPDLRIRESADRESGSF